MARDSDPKDMAGAGIGAGRGRVARVFRERFLRRAAEPEAEEEVQSSLDDKMASIEPGHGGREKRTRERLRKLVGEAREIWKHRSKLSREDYLLLAAALLYFISPLDAVPDVIPVVGYLDDVAVLIAVLKKLSKVVPPAVRRGAEEVKSWGNDFVQENVDEALSKIDRASEEALGRTVTSISIGLWAATSVAAISLLVTEAGNGEIAMWRAYVVACGGLILVWNLMIGFQFWRLMRSAEGIWQRRLVAAVVSKVGVGHAVQLGLPVLLLAGLGIARLFAQ